MTQSEKELLLKDLCARLPYDVKVEAKGLLKMIADDYDNRDIINAHVLNGLNLRDYFKTYSIDSIEKVPLFNRKGVCNIKPYLFPLSSMTEEQKSQYSFFLTRIIDGYDSSLLIDWLNKNHFDYRGLIPKGLAIDATGLNIY
jgi:hypothetical protein